MNELKVVEKTAGGVVLSETKTYEAKIEDIQRELDNLVWRKKDLIEQNGRIRRDYAALAKREESLSAILKQLKEAEPAVDLGLGGQL